MHFPESFTNLDYNLYTTGILLLHQGSVFNYFPQRQILATAWTKFAEIGQPEKGNGVDVTIEQPGDAAGHEVPDSDPAIIAAHC